LFLKNKIWGLTGDHSKIVLSLREGTEFYPDTLKEYVFNGNELFYRQTPDSLIVYYDSMTSQPKTFDTSVKLKFIEIDNYNLLNEEAKKGLKKFEN
jgi:hypothetical protein